MTRHIAPITLIIATGVLACSILSALSSTYFRFGGESGASQSAGVWITNGSGNAGKVIFDRDAGIDGAVLTGAFSIQTVGIVRWDTGTTIVPPANQQVIGLWTISGSATSLYAGRIFFTGASYDPVSNRLIGNAWNAGIGIIPLSSTGVLVVNPITSSGIAQGFQGRVKVLGTIGGINTFNQFYTVGANIRTTLFADTLNRIRQNIALLTRNIPSNRMNAAFDGSSINVFGNKIFFINNTPTVTTLKYSDISTVFPSASLDSLIIIGGDLLIDTDLLEPVVRQNPKGIIVLQNAAGKGGNAIVTGNVKKIQSSLFTEGSLYSGTGIANLYNATTANVPSLPENQLYIHGSLLSHNTIGGATQSGSAVCVYGETSCSYAQAVRYDLNYFRLTPPTRTGATRAYGDSTLDSYAVIIEADPRILSNPPPGWESR